MAVYADRVKETTTTTGTGTYSLAGAAAGYQTFVAGVGDGSVVAYVCEDGTDWEIGEGTVTDGSPDTLSRTTIWASTNAGAAVSWAAGTKNIFLTIPAKRLNSLPVNVTASNVNHATISSANTGVGPAISVTGSDSNIPLAFGSKGDGYHLFYNDIGTSLTAKRATSSDNQLDIQNNTGNTELSVTGTPSDLSLKLTPKGTGQILVPDGAIATPSIAFGSDTNNGIYRTGADGFGIAVDGNLGLEVVDLSGGTPANGIQIGCYGAGGSPDISAIGSASDIPLNLYAKGQSSVRLYNADVGKMAAFYAASGSTTQIDFSTNAGYVLTVYSDRANWTTATINNQIVAGTSTGAQHFFQSYNGTSYRNMFGISHGATVTGVQNYINVYSDNTGGAPSVEAEGGDTNINLDFWSKGTGSIRLNGTSTTVSSAGAVSTTQAFTHSGSTAHTVSTTGAVTFTGAVVQSTKGFAAAEYDAGSGAPGTITWSNGQNQVKTLTSAGTMTFSTPTAGATYKLRIVQGGLGSFTITWPTIKWAGGVAPTLSTAAGAEDIISLYYNGTSYYGQAGIGFA